MDSQLWRRKIIAYLSWPPDRVLDEASAPARGRNLIALALGEADEKASRRGRGPSERDLAAADRAHALAAGPDLLPLLHLSPTSSFTDKPLFRHPITGVNLQDAPGADDLPAAADAARCVAKAVKKIRKDLGKSPCDEAVYLALWRLLPDRIAETETILGTWWRLVPADPRMPAVTIWNHAATASAIASALPEPATLLFTIASVQDFVTTAKRTQDAWMGSFLIGHLMEAAITTIAERAGPDAVLSPSLREHPWIDRWLLKRGVSVEDPCPSKLIGSGFPNILSAIVPEPEADEIAGAAEDALRERWSVIAHEVENAWVATLVESRAFSASGADSVQKLRMAWQCQIADFLDHLGIYWSVGRWGTASTVGDLEEAYREFSKPEPSDNRHGPINFVDHVYRAEGMPEKVTPPERHAALAYPLAAALAGRALTARKRLRDFPQGREDGWKCTLCGVRSALHLDGTKVRDFWEKVATLDRPSWPDGSSKGLLKFLGRIRRSEMLCAVCLTKRFALEAYFEPKFKFDHHLFPSTATVATAPFVDEVLRHRASIPSLDPYVTCATELVRNRFPHPSSGVPRLRSAVPEGSADHLVDLDGEWLYTEAFAARKLARQYGVKEEGVAAASAEAVDRLNELLAAARKLKIQPPSRYYAVLAADGDHMGDWIAGRKSPSYCAFVHPDLEKALGGAVGGASRPVSPGFHAALSEALHNFSTEVVPFVIERCHRGKLIYTGGDDILAILPVVDLLPAMRELRMLYQGRDLGAPLTAEGRTITARNGLLTIASADAVRYSTTMGSIESTDHQSPTISIGAVIAHESHPLNDVLSLAIHSALDEHAKNDLGRDAFAVHLLTRSGSLVRAGASFDLIKPPWGDRIDTLADLQTVVKAIAENKLSPSLSGTMAAVAPALEGLVSGPKPEWWQAAQRTELGRILERQCHADKANEAIWGLLEGLQNQTAVLAGERGFEQKSDPAWPALGRLLYLARFLGRQSGRDSGEVPDVDLA